jgi:hypothetical protein
LLLSCGGVRMRPEEEPIRENIIAKRQPSVVLARNNQW